MSLHCPSLTEVWHPLGEALRLRSSSPLRLSEFAILITARAWDCDYIFVAHTKFALEGGLSQSVIDALARSQRPKFEREDEAARAFGAGARPASSGSSDCAARAHVFDVFLRVAEPR